MSEQTPLTSAQSTGPATPNFEPHQLRDPLVRALLPDAKHARISRWCSEVNPSDVICSCSERLELHTTNKSAAAACGKCGCSGETMEQKSHELRAGASTAPGGLGSSPRQQQQQHQGKRTSVFKKIFARRRAARDVATDSVTESAAGSRGSSRPRVLEDGGTQMYHQDEADDEASGSSLSAESDGAKGNRKPKLGLDDTAARLRRAQRLLNAQAVAK